MDLELLKNRIAELKASEQKSQRDEFIKAFENMTDDQKSELFRQVYDLWQAQLEYSKLLLKENLGIK